MKEIPVNQEEEAAQAVELENQAKSGPGFSTYTHIFEEPFQYGGQSFESLTFDFGKLTGADSIQVEWEMNSQGRTLVVDSFSQSYLCGMAARACTQRDSRGIKLIDSDAIAALPLLEFRAIVGRARSFLLRSEWWPGTGCGNRA